MNEYAVASGSPENVYEGAPVRRSDELDEPAPVIVMVRVHESAIDVHDGVDATVLAVAVAAAVPADPSVLYGVTVTA